MSKMFFQITVFVLVVSLWSFARADVIYSDSDTMIIEDTNGFPGDTIEVAVVMANPSFDIGGVAHRILYDQSILEIESIYCVNRGCNLETSFFNFPEPGLIRIAAVSQQLNLIPTGSGPVYILSFVVSETAPNMVTQLEFANEEFYDNAWADSVGYDLIIPILKNGQVTISSATGVDDDIEAPAKFDLVQNYPNPFNAETRISFIVESPSLIDLSVYDILGKKVAVLYSGFAEAGRRDIYWDARSSTGNVLPTGVYFYRLTDTRGNSITKRMTLLK